MTWGGMIEDFISTIRENTVIFLLKEVRTTFGGLRAAARNGSGLADFTLVLLLKTFLTAATGYGKPTTSCPMTIPIIRVGTWRTT